jgi:hypothetical protein
MFSMLELTICNDDNTKLNQTYCEASQSDFKQQKKSRFNTKMYNRNVTNKYIYEEGREKFFGLRFFPQNDSFI